jgi:hypothetical protein
VLEPENGAAFEGQAADVILRWSDVGPLGADDYYVVRVPHDAEGGVAEFWLKETSLVLPDYLYQADYAFPDRGYRWTVHVMRCTKNCDPAADDDTLREGIPLGDESAEGMFYWRPGSGPER